MLSSIKGSHPSTVPFHEWLSSIKVELGFWQQELVLSIKLHIKGRVLILFVVLEFNNKACLSLITVQIICTKTSVFYNLFIACLSILFPEHYMFGLGINMSCPVQFGKRCLTSFEHFDSYSASPYMANMHHDGNSIRNIQVVFSNRVHSTHLCEANKCRIFKPSFLFIR